MKRLVCQEEPACIQGPVSMQGPGCMQKSVISNVNKVDHAKDQTACRGRAVCMQKSDGMHNLVCMLQRACLPHSPKQDLETSNEGLEVVMPVVIVIRIISQVSKHLYQ